MISNSDVYNLMQNEEFFTACHQIRSVWAPIKECINILEAKSASLADCFIQMIKLAVAIFRLPSSNLYKPAAIQVFNRRYLEFQHPAYLLCYCLHPYYRGKVFIVINNYYFSKKKFIKIIFFRFWY